MLLKRTSSLQSGHIKSVPFPPVTDSTSPPSPLRPPFIPDIPNMLPLFRGIPLLFPPPPPNFFSSTRLFCLRKISDAFPRYSLLRSGAGQTCRSPNRFLFPLKEALPCLFIFSQRTPHIFGALLICRIPHPTASQLFDDFPNWQGPVSRVIQNTSFIRTSPGTSGDFSLLSWAIPLSRIFPEEIPPFPPAPTSPPHHSFIEAFSR